MTIEKNEIKLKLNPTISLKIWPDPLNNKNVSLEFSGWNGPFWSCLHFFLFFLSGKLTHPDPPPLRGKFHFFYFFWNLALCMLRKMFWLRYPTLSKTNVFAIYKVFNFVELFDMIKLNNSLKWFNQTVCINYGHAQACFYCKT